MKTRVFRIELNQSDLHNVIAQKCDTQLLEGFKLVSTFVYGEDLVLIFQTLA